jgi:hypothetical protein
MSYVLVAMIYSAMFATETCMVLSSITRGIEGDRIGLSSARNDYVLPHESRASQYFIT